MNPLSLLLALGQWAIANPLESISVAAGLTSVILIVCRKIIGWPIGLIYVVISIYLYWSWQLYSDMLLHIYYFPMQLYGWWHWARGGKEYRPAKITLLSSRSRGGWCLGVLIGTLMLGAFMDHFTNAAYPYGDAFTTVASLLGQYLWARKVLESWAVWIAVDTVAPLIYYLKSLDEGGELLGYMVLYFIYLGLAIWGLIGWIRAYRRGDLI